MKGITLKTFLVAAGSLLAAASLTFSSGAGAETTLELRARLLAEGAATKLEIGKEMDALKIKLCEEGNALRPAARRKDCSIAGAAGLPTVSYAWVTAYGSCSTSCGGGTRTPIFSCQDSSNKIVTNSLCPVQKPNVSTSCNTQACATNVDTIKPTVPGSVLAAATGCTAIEVTWSASTDTGGSGLKGYDVYRDGNLLTQVMAPLSGLSDSALQPATGHSYAVAAFDGQGNRSSQSVVQSASTPACSNGGSTPVASVVGSLALKSASIGVNETGTVAVVAARDSGIYVIDLKNPAKPAIVGTLDLPYREFAAATDGAYAYVIEALPDGGASLAVVDIRTLSAPVFVARISLPGKFAGAGVAVQRGLAYVSATDAGFQVVDVNAPAVPLIVGSVPKAMPALRMDVEEGVAFLGNGGSFVVIDARNPRNPVQLLGGWLGAYGFDAVRGMLVFTNPGQIGLWNTSDPTRMPWFGSMAPGGSDVAVVSHYAVVAVASGVQIVDIMDPARPRAIQDLAIGRDVVRMVSAGSLVLAIDSTSMLSVISLAP